MDPKFNRVVTRCFEKLVNNVRFSEVKDRLRTERLISREQYAYLSSFRTEEESNRHLLNEILSKRGPGTYSKFRQSLLSVKGQEHIVHSILDPEDRKQSTSEDDSEETCDQPPKKTENERPTTSISTRKTREAETSSSESEEDYIHGIKLQG
jgi:hypothetical protein